MQDELSNIHYSAPDNEGRYHTDYSTDENPAAIKYFSATVASHCYNKRKTIIDNFKLTLTKT